MYMTRVIYTQVTSHCFDPNDGEESCVMLGAAHGALRWEEIHARSCDSSSLAAGEGTAYGYAKSADDLTLSPGELRSKIPYAGIFGAFTSPVVDDLAAVRASRLWEHCARLG